MKEDSEVKTILEAYTSNYPFYMKEHIIHAYQSKGLNGIKELFDLD